MTTRSLTIQIDPAGLATLAAAGQRVVLVKSGTGSAVTVVWQAFPPLQQSLVSWQESYQVYASTTPLVAGTTLTTVATATASAGGTYPFAGGGFGAGSPGLPLSQLAVHNQDSQVTIGGIPMITAGAAQTGTVNGTAVPGPLDAQAVPYRDLAVSVLSELVLVLPAGGVTTGTLLDPAWLTRTAGRPAPVGIVLGAPLAVDFTATTSQTVHYSDTTNAFAPGALT